ncbi:MAG: hypothetical protein LBP19_01025 [Treponema sp.]|jgi:hypothetical protein|nr:hypothetical protein [Treponema sp.]
MAEVLSQDEIDQLLTAISAGDSRKTSFDNIEVFEDYLTKRKFTPDKPYGIFDKDITICRFFDSGNEAILEDIKRKNEEQGEGNITIPNTNITLINYSFCPQCKTIFSFKEIINYYMNPKPDQRYKQRAYQYREDTRVYCTNCDIYFLPSLIISDGTPKNEVQFLCRVQTINAVEKHFARKNINVLTRNKKNIVQKGGVRAIKNDVFIKDLDEKPTLITNMLQYTPYHLIMNLIAGTNVEKGDLLFNEWS